jgi:hypothetical protein
VTKNYVADLQHALRDLLMMASEREQLEKKIAKQKKRVAALYELAQTDEDVVPLPNLTEGLTDACRIALRAIDVAMTPSQIRDHVQGLGVPSQTNLLASIHTTLKRMKENDEVREETINFPSGDKVVAYRWNEQKTDLAALDPSSAEFKRRAAEYYKTFALAADRLGKK